MPVKKKPQPKNRTVKVRVNRVIDGDTVEVLEGSFFTKPTKRRLRLWGIDAPESTQQGGTASTLHLRRLIGNKKHITMETRGIDQYQRTIAIIYGGPRRIENSYNYRMLKDGQAQCYMLDGQEKFPYQQAEDYARQRTIGLWKLKQQPDPWNYRKQRQQTKRLRNLLLRYLIIGALLAAIVLTILYCSP